jgi:hypothetical protein
MFPMPAPGHARQLWAGVSGTYLLIGCPLTIHKYDPPAVIDLKPRSFRPVAVGERCRRRQVQVTEALPPGSGATVPVPRPPM